MHTEYEYMVSQQEDNMSTFEGYPGTGGFYDPAPISDEAPTHPEPSETHHLKAARRHMAEFEHRINDDRVRFSDIVDRQVYEDRAYKQAIMHAAIAQAEAATRQAEVAESMLEFVAELIDKTGLVNSLLQWGYKQERIG